MTQTLSSMTLAGEIHQRVERAIVEGRYRPGQRLITDELAAAFGVSRIPVREALRGLDAAGWVEIRPRLGVYVRRWSRSELEQLFDVRALLEGQAALLAAERRTEDHMLQLKTNVVDYERAIRGHTPDVPELNRQFHRIISRAAANLVLDEHLAVIGRRVQWYFFSVMAGRSLESAHEHRELLAALEAHDAAKSKTLMIAHVGRTRAAVASVLAELDPELIDP